MFIEYHFCVNGEMVSDDIWQHFVIDEFELPRDKNPVETLTSLLLIGAEGFTLRLEGLKIQFIRERSDMRFVSTSRVTVS